ncbi:S1C family serine protease [Stratiformator vulcanicus]|nr:trypsin-like peptidase domain-containing protein [Stratiformator vulcanicus]
MTSRIVRSAQTASGTPAVMSRTDDRLTAFRNLFLLSLPAILVLLGGKTASADGVDVDESVLAAQNERIEVINGAAPSVVAVFGAAGGGGGSGVLISKDGFALTNFHVTEPCGDFMKCGLNDGKLYDAVIVGIDPTGDVALIKLLGRDDFPFSPLGDSDALSVGDSVYAMGNPFLLATDFSPTVTFGIVSGLHRYQYPEGSGKNLLEYTDCIQVDASINPGNSGGPLFNAKGEVVGINGRIMFEKRVRINSGVGYAISINQIKNFMGHLKSGRVVDHATLGATVATDWDGTIRFQQVSIDSEAYRRGIREGDELVSFAGRPIRSVNQFKNVLGIFPKGWKLPLTFRSGDQTASVQVRLQPLHQESELKFDKPELPDGHPAKAKQPKPPEEYADLLEKKDGFSNYYFNRQAQKRLLSGLKEWGDFGGAGASWGISGSLQNGSSYRITLTPKVAGLDVAERAAFLQPLTAADRLIDEPVGTGGLLAALHHLKLLLTEGSAGFADFYYLGTEPLDGTGPMIDILMAERAGTQTRFLFSVETGRFVGIDFRLDEFSDECEIRFAEPKQLSSRKFPQSFKARSGGETFATFAVEGLSVRAKSGENE